MQGLVTAPFGCIVGSRGESFTPLTAMPNISVNYAAPWDKRYWAKDYADEALRILTRSSRWPAGSLVVQHTDPASPTHWRVVSVRGVQQPG
jgi:hypothetical protein